MFLDFKVGGGDDGRDSQLSARMELDCLKQRVAELEAQLGLRKRRGLKFTVSGEFLMMQ